MRSCGRHAHAHLQQLQRRIPIVLLCGVGQEGEHRGLALLERRRLLFKQSLVRLQRALLLWRQGECLLRLQGKGRRAAVLQRCRKAALPCALRSI